MVNQYRLEEEDEVEQQDPDVKDLFITVDHPESHVTAIETFITYRVVTKVRGPACISGETIRFAKRLTVQTLKFLRVLRFPPGHWENEKLHSQHRRSAVQKRHPTPKDD